MTAQRGYTMRTAYSLLLISALASLAGAATNVSGPITSDTVWTKANQPYRVAGAITVNSGATLTIQPGVDVLFDADVQFVVQGALHAVGTEADSIRFIKGTAAEWEGIRISGGDSSTMAYARISDAHGDTGEGANGGGINLSGTGTRLGLAHMVISGNIAYNGSGVFNNHNATLTMTNCTISGNTASNAGGGLFARATVTLTNCTISRNAAPYGGAVLNEASTLTITNCTISGNSASLGGGLYSQSSATATLTNAILWGNSPAQQIYIYTGSSPSATYSDIQGGYPGTGNINADPLFSTHPDSVYHLTGASPCIDAGDPASPLDPDSTRADMGAFYFQQLGPAPVIVSVRDVPNDQGGRVIVRWFASSLDNNTGALPKYSVWCALPAGAAKPADGRTYRVAKVGSVEYIWGWLADCPAIRQSSYWYAAPTLYDSMSSTDALHNFMVIAHTSAPNVFHMSNVMGGRSADNLAPAAPKIAGARAAGKITISWSPNAEADLKHYAVYRSSTPGINPAALAPFATITDTLFVDDTPLPGTTYYVVRAQDVHENFSLKSNEVAIVPTGVATGRTPTAFTLAQNIPNPFNPATTLRFSVAEAGAVRLVIFDVNGRLVRTLVDGEVETGMHEVAWEGTDASGREVSSGMYLYRLTYAGRTPSDQGTVTRKMVLVR